MIISFKHNRKINNIIVLECVNSSDEFTIKDKNSKLTMMESFTIQRQIGSGRSVFPIDNTTDFIATFKEDMTEQELKTYKQYLRTKKLKRILDDEQRYDVSCV